MVSIATKNRKQRLIKLIEMFMRFIREFPEPHTIQDINLFKSLISHKKHVVATNNIDLVLMAYIFICQKKTLIVSSHVNSFKFRRAAKKYLNHNCSILSTLDVASQYTIVRKEYCDIKWDRVVYFDVPSRDDITAMTTIKVSSHMN